MKHSRLLLWIGNCDIKDFEQYYTTHSNRDTAKRYNLKHHSEVSQIATYLNISKTAEQRCAIRKQTAICTYQSLSENAKNQRSNKIALASHKMWKNLNDVQKSEICDKISNALKYDNKDEEYIQKTHINRSKASIERESLLSENIKANKQEKWRQWWNSDESTQAKERTRQVLQQRIANLTDEEKKQIGQKTSEWWHQQSQQTQDKIIAKRVSSYNSKSIAEKSSIVQKRLSTQYKNHTFNTSKPEEQMYTILCQSYGEENVFRQYSSQQYSYRVDFYVKCCDFYIELNLHYTHGQHPFDKNNMEDIQKLNYIRSKQIINNGKKNSYFTYENVWTIRDVEKQNVATQNNLNYIMIYPKMMVAKIKSHKLDEWRDFCEILKQFPYGEELITYDYC